MSHFIFMPGVWLGYGSFEITGGKEPVIYYTKWLIEPENKGLIKATQRVEIQGVKEPLINKFSFSDFKEHSFLVSFKNEHVQERQGEGSLNAEQISWEFKEQKEFQGKEKYILTHPARYLLEGFYISPGEVSNVIRGHLWHK